MILLIAGLAAQAENYQIIVGGVEVTSDNFNNVTGDDIKSGTVSYNPSTKVLTLNNAHIMCVSNIALHNSGCSDLKVKFVGNNTLYSMFASAIKVNSGCGLTLDFNGGETWIKSQDNDAIIVHSDSRYHLDFEGTGRVVISSDATYGMRSDAHCLAGFSGSSTGEPLNVDVYGPKGAINWIHQVAFWNYSCVVKLKATGNSSYPVITTGAIAFIGTYASIIEPQGAVVSSDGTTINYNGVPVYNQDIVIAANNVGYVATINETNFPDANFRNFLLLLYPKGYLTQNDINNCTSLNLYDLGISDLTGIGFFTELEGLSCRNNSLTSLNLSNNTKLTYLYCENNNLTSITGIPSTLRTLLCSNNSFTNFGLTDQTALERLDFKDCTSLTSLSCYRNNLTMLNVTGCTALNRLDCFGNANLTAITGLADCTAITYLNCEDCMISDLSVVNSLSNINKLFAGGNRLSSLTLANKNNLNYLRVSNNTSLTVLNVFNNPALASIYANDCSALNELHCFSNALTSLNVWRNTAMTILNCYDNPNLTSITGFSDCTALKELYCYNTGLTDLNSINRCTNLEVLSCANTKITKLDCGDMEHLKRVYCYDNPQLTTLTLTNCDQMVTLNCKNCPVLTKLDCNSDGFNGKLTSLSLTGTTALEYLSCNGQTGLSSITNLANCTALKELYCYDCAFTSLSDISGMTKLEMLYCSGNRLTTLNVTNNTKLTELDFSGNSGLTTVTGLANCTVLKYLECRNCALTSLSGVTYLSNLEDLYCYNNQLTSLNLQGCTSLQTLVCFNNNLTSITVNGLVALRLIKCNNNQLTSLNVSGCSALNEIDCYQNLISGSGMSTLVNTLPTRTSSSKGKLYAIYNTDEGNTMTFAQVTNAHNKYWTPKYFNGSSWMDYVPNAEAYAEYTPSNTTLTFYCDNLRSTRTGTTYDLNEGTSYPRWRSSGTSSSVTRVVFDPSFAAARPTSAYFWFENMSKLTTISGINYLNTSEVTNMREMFAGCNALTSLDLSGFNTAKVTSMEAMFIGCRGLTSLDLSSFNTSNVTTMKEMFNNCSGMTSLDLSGFNTSNVTTMLSMFRVCTSLTSLNVSGFNTSSVTKMDYMFYGCSELTTINVGNEWTTATVTNSDNMFYNCTKIRGEKGTTYDANHIDAAYAHIDGGPSNPGYLSGEARLGDVTGDGIVDVVDVTALIGAILNGTHVNPAIGDINHDDSVDVADVTALISRILNGN